MLEIARSLDSQTTHVSGVRRFVEDDVPRVADLHRRVFGSGKAIKGSAGAWISYRRFFDEVFLGGAPHVDGIESLVYQEGSGSISGFLGVHPRRMLFEERPITMAVCSHFAVDPTRRGQFGLRLLKRCLEGPQDLSLSDESGDNTRRLWEWCGGTTALLYSMHWVRPLQPATAPRTSPMSSSPRPAGLWAPATSMADAVCDRLAHGPLPMIIPSGSREDLDEAMLAARLPEFAGGRSLRPDYSDASLSWIMKRAGTRHAGGPLRRVLVRDQEQQIAGWYLYYANRGGISEVLQIAARKDRFGVVLDHLLYDASECGATALAGRLDPAFAQELSEKDCFFYRRGHWTLIHSSRPELLHAIERGDAFLTRMEGEWCLHFR
jgi:hypothetical protein